MGGGQLGRMFVHAAQRMGYFTRGARPRRRPARPGCVAHHHIHTDYLDAARPGAAGRSCAAAITTEFENVPAAALATLARSRPVAPGADAVAICQDRGRREGALRALRRAPARRTR